MLLTFFHLRLDDVFLLDDLHRQFVDPRLLLVEFLLESQDRLTQLIEMLQVLELFGVQGGETRVVLLQFTADRSLLLERSFQALILHHLALQLLLKFFGRALHFLQCFL